MKKRSINPIYELELKEIIEKLKKDGYEDIVNCLLENEAECYTRSGRLNKSATSRKLGCKSKQLEDKLKSMRDILIKELGLEDEDCFDDSE